MPLCCRILIFASLSATAASTLSVYPHQLAYFNEVAGGPENGHKHLLGSNLDWGQDLLFVKDFQRSHGIADLRLACLALLNPADLGIEFNVPSIGSQGRVESGVYCVSGSVLAGDPFPLAESSGGSKAMNAEVLVLLNDLQPTDVIGVTLQVFEIGPEVATSATPPPSSSN